MTSPSKLPWDWIKHAGWPGCYVKDEHYYSPDEPRPQGCDYIRFDDPAIVEQPAPVTNDSVPLWSLVLLDAQKAGLPDKALKSMRARMEFGKAKHGTYLQADNGRVNIVDMLQELLDAAVYAKGAALEDPRWEVSTTYHDILRLIERLYRHDIVAATLSEEPTL